MTIDEITKDPMANHPNIIRIPFIVNFLILKWWVRYSDAPYQRLLQAFSESNTIAISSSQRKRHSLLCLGCFASNQKSELSGRGLGTDRHKVTIRTLIWLDSVQFLDRTNALLYPSKVPRLPAFQP